MSNYIVIPKSGKTITTKTHGGRSYTASAGTALTVPMFDAHVLGANGWIQVCETGTTAQRPAAPGNGKVYLDTTLTLVIVFDGALWRDPTSGSAV